jgi:hypothetical protein
MPPEDVYGIGGQMALFGTHRDIDHAVGATLSWGTHKHYKRSTKQITIKIFRDDGKSS